MKIDIKEIEQKMGKDGRDYIEFIISELQELGYENLKKGEPCAIYGEKDGKKYYVDLDSNNY